ncbi:hypothetical protein EDD75_2217 [Thermodesulfitimonas autotrophica]|uniref:Uncharacterized protein n=1 Tax=Thermodesulfitimonas autotrophica TaxID=1894989 RepID=A0A3N5AAX4_9THEO|nr:hypothetical protein [Thermodesulfitimonas autotrophica]RPF41996.1 hypothetical protein EDD75_2217 [Thermodesulfitimonas autotrophica]
MFPYCDYTTTVIHGLTFVAAGLFGLAVVRVTLQAAFASACGRVAGAMIADMVLFCALVILACNTLAGTGFLAAQVQDAINQLTAPVQEVMQVLNNPGF